MPTEADRLLIESALAYAGGTHTVDDVLAMIAEGRCQLWRGPNAAVVTEIDEYPREKVLHFFLAAGDMKELEAMQDGIMAWGIERGCTKARFVGRRGWQRTFMARTGWRDTRYIIMEKSLNG